MGSTKIEWADAVWNPVTGCTKVSRGCQNCYAARMAKRLAGRSGYPADDPFKVTLRPDRLERPLRWRKPRRIFVCSMGDLLHPDVPDEFILKVAIVMAMTPHHTYLVLSKRVRRMVELCRAAPWFGKAIRAEQLPGLFPNLPVPACALHLSASVLAQADADRRRTCLRAYSLRQTQTGAPGLNVGVSTFACSHRILPNVWWGTSIEDQATAHERIPELSKCPAAVNFLSCEPLLGPIDFSPWIYKNACGCLEPDIDVNPRDCPHCKGTGAVCPIDWVIVGAETGPGARPMKLEWARSIRDHCQAAGVPFFFKQCSGKAYWEQPIPEDLMIRQYPE